ncbi:MAG: rhodanese-like domain-containing protein [Gammaproteobacteria bacterium]|nr:rhodanese-like domain-containing protein [Gammaproteobacteria bacterium]
MMKIIYLIPFILTLMLLSACGNKVDDQVLIKAHEAYNSREAIIIDVRTPGEYKAKHISGARNFPLQSLPKDLRKLPKDKQLILYCRSGNRSATAATFLKHRGFEVFDVATQAEWERGQKLIIDHAKLQSSPK